jgi:hypothetical protein
MYLPVYGCNDSSESALCICMDESVQLTNDFARQVDDFHEVRGSPTMPASKATECTLQNL